LSSARAGLRVRLGALAWLLAAQFFVAQIVVAAAWTTPFSLKTRNISDLGNTRCGSAKRSSLPPACSPLHAVMNASFIVVGLTMAAGGILARGAFRPGWQSSLAVAFFVAAGAGVVLVGVFPENEHLTNHTIGAGLNFVAGNLALILFGGAVPSQPPRPVFAAFSTASGVVGLIALVLFVSRQDLGIGLGAVERVVAYTTTIWQIAAGLILFRSPQWGADGGR